MRVCTYVAFLFFAALPTPLSPPLCFKATGACPYAYSPCWLIANAPHPVYQELPSTLRSRTPESYLTKDELVKVVRWKLWMGVVRPNLLRFATETDPKQVRT